jgi:hypothetical protein
MTPRSLLALAVPPVGASLALVLVAACSSSTPAGPACNPCTDAGTQVTITGRDTNPDGLSYPKPAGTYGHTARSGKTPGSIIANLSFLGYPDGDTSKGLQVVSLADYYDPCGKRLKLLHLSVAGVWCNPCNQETAAFAAAGASLKSQGVVVLQALSDGPTEGVGATQQDLVYWVGRYRPSFTEMLDPGPTQFAGFFRASSIPWNGDVDPRTMELIDSTTGWSAAAGVMGELQPGLDAVAAPPLYPIAASAACNDQ